MRFVQHTALLRALCFAFTLLYGSGAIASEGTGLERFTLGTMVPKGMEARSTALILSDAKDWDAKTRTRAERLAQMHTLVIALDASLLRQSSRFSCATLAGDLTTFATTIQTRTGAYARRPVLVGSGDGVDLALSAAHGSPALFKGLVTQSAAQPDNFCETHHERQAKSPLRWLDLSVSPDTSPATDLAGATVIAQDQNKTSANKAFSQAYLRIAGTDSAFDLGDLAQTAALADLPLTLHHSPKAVHSGTYAIFLSGDGGWARFDEEVADRLAASGIPTVGISSLRYLWHEKSPGQIAKDLTRIDAHYRNAFAAERVMLVGFSLGANVLPFAAPDLPGDIRENLAALVLLAPETQTGFEIVVGGWLGQATGATEVAPQIERAVQTGMAGPVLCLYGSEESVSACPRTTHAEIQLLEFKGGHHLGNDWDRIAARLTHAALRATRSAALASGN